MNFSAQAIAQALQQFNAATRLHIEVVAQTGSTNADLMQALAGLVSPVCLVAERQTAGRGRAGRTWLSDEGEVLTFSLAWHFAKTALELQALPLVVGVALAHTLTELGVPVRLKWPNDLIKEGKKLGGILVESQAGKQGGTWAVIGVGLNLRVPTSLEQKIGQEVADAQWLAQMDHSLLLAHLLNGLERNLLRFAELGFAEFQKRWNELHVHMGQSVAIMDQGSVLQQGVALGVATDGCLMLQTEAGIVMVHSGDVSLRSMN